MNARQPVTLLGILVTLVLSAIAGSLLTGSAVAAPSPDPIAHAKELIGAYKESNARLADCMHQRGLPFDGGLVRSDVMDAFKATSGGALNPQAKAEIAALTETTPDDRNDALLAGLPASEQTAWVDAVNSCGEQVSQERAGDIDAFNEISERQRVADNSPEVQAAAQDYVKCMKAQGFTVAEDPFVAPKDVMYAEHAASAAAKVVLDGYEVAWRECVAPYQRIYDQKLFG